MSEKELIISKIDSLKELFEQRFSHIDSLHMATNDHLKRLNSQTSKNTEFRLTMGTKVKVIIGVGGVLVPLIVSAAVSKFL